MCVCRMSENCKSLVLQDKCNIEIFLSPDIIMVKYHISLGLRMHSLNAPSQIFRGA